jgi:hypothetical protein
MSMSIASIAQQAAQTELIRQQNLARDPIGAAAALITTPDQALLADQSLSSFIGLAPLSSLPSFANDFKGSPLTTIPPIPPVGTPFQPITLNGGQTNNFSVLNNVLQADPTKDTQIPGIFPSANPIRPLSTPTPNPINNTGLLPTGLPSGLPQGLGTVTTTQSTPVTPDSTNANVASAKAAILAPSNSPNPFDSMPKTAATTATNPGQAIGGKRSLDDVLTQLLDSDPKGKSTPKPPETSPTPVSSARNPLPATVSPQPSGGQRDVFGNPVNPVAPNAMPVVGGNGGVAKVDNGRVTTGINFLDKDPSGKTVSLSGSEFFNLTQRLSGKPTSTAKILQQAGLGDLTASVDAELNKKTLDFSAKQAANPQGTPQK